ncbi:hypothetical protein HYALB_00001719 [Hymenoscyphus albidus]|uniref:Uncharacterized protein n=1 Tax=Hymenoscyphus albidus TaxID=595503 RepID=A0A9N9Q2F0_9HELO|nr:hypothetical protein HYALB_00001719 [Hymenoscyphus albidus]
MPVCLHTYTIQSNPIQLNGSIQPFVSPPQPPSEQVNPAIQSPFPSLHKRKEAKREKGNHEETNSSNPLPLRKRLFNHTFLNESIVFPTDLRRLILASSSPTSSNPKSAKNNLAGSISSRTASKLHDDGFETLRELATEEHLRLEGIASPITLSRREIRPVDLFDRGGERGEERFDRLDADDGFGGEGGDVEICVSELGTDGRGVGILGIPVGAWGLDGAAGYVVQMCDSTTHCGEETAGGGAEEEVEGNGIGGAKVGVEFGEVEAIDIFEIHIGWKGCGEVEKSVD